MKKVKDIISNALCFLIVMLMIGISIYSYTIGKKSNEYKETSDTTVIYRNITYRDTVYTPAQYIYNNDTIHLYHYRIDTVLLPSVIDTQAVIMGYYSSVYAVDTILNDTNGFIVIEDSISMNRIQKRAITSMKLYPRVTKVTKYKEKKFKRSFFGGVGVAGNEQSLGLNVQLGVLYNPDLLLVTAYDVIRKDFSVGVYWRINFKLFK